MANSTRATAPASLALMAQAEQAGIAGVRAAHRIALMQQSLEATAGLLGNAVHAALASPHQAIDAAERVAHVARTDPAVHNTRRFAAADLVLGGERLTAGQELVLVLVPGWPFGAGAHACPGERIARQLAATALATLRSMAPLERSFGRLTGYRPLPNIRIPIFQTGANA